MRLFFSLLLLLTVGITAAQDATPEAVTEFTDHPARVVTNINALNMRSSPAIEADNIVGRLQPGQQVHVLARDGDWQQVRREDGLIGWSHSDYLIDLSPRQLGETRLFRFYDPSVDRNVVVNAELRHVGAYNYIYFNSREGDSRAISTDLLRRIGNTFDDEVYSQTLALWSEGKVPSIEGDERLVILLVDGYYNITNRYRNGWYAGRNDMPGELNPYDNRVGFLGVRWLEAFNTERYGSILAHEFQHMIQHTVDRNEKRWVNEGLAEFTQAHLFSGDSQVLDIGLYFKLIRDIEHNPNSLCGAPLLSLLSDLVSGSEATSYGAWQLFMTYIFERFGLDTLQHFARHPENGLTALNTVFSERDIELDADTFFADWVLANYLQDRQLDDGRYGYELLDQFPAGSPPPIGHITQLPAQIQGVGYQYATNYYEFHLPAADQTRNLMLKLQLTAPFSQDAWLQLVQVADDRVILQRFRVSDYRGQSIPASLEAGAIYAFLAISLFTPSQLDKTGLTDYTLNIFLEDDAGETLASANTTYNVTTAIHKNELIQAAMMGDAQGVAIQLLSKNYGSQGTERLHRETALQEAAAAGHDDVVALLTLTDLDLFAEDDNGLTAQELAAAGGHAEVLELLRIASLDPDLRKDIERPSAWESQEITDAFLRAARAGDLTTLEQLFDRIAYIDVIDPQSHTALHIAARHGQRNTVLRLLRAGAGLHKAGGGQYQLPLYYAIENDLTEIATLLIIAGTPLHYDDQSDRTALHMAAVRGNADIVGLLLTDSEEARINAGNASGITALFSASIRGHLEIVNMLLDAGADPDILSEQSYHALYYSIYEGHFEIMKRLVAAGADPNGGGNGTWIPLDIAARRGSIEMVEILLNAGANPSYVNPFGETAAQVTRSRGYHTVARMLETAAAKLN